MRNWAQLHNRMDNMYRNDNPDLPSLEPWVLKTRPPSERFVFERAGAFYNFEGLRKYKEKFTAVWEPRYLAWARAQGDVLIVGVNADASVRRLKGASRPFVAEEDRQTLLAALAAVDYVTPFDEDTPERLIQEIRPDVLVKGADWEGKEVAGQRFVEAGGGRVLFAPLLEGRSTTHLAGRIKAGG